MPNSLLNIVVGFFLALLGAFLMALTVGERERELQGLVSDQRGSTIIRRVANTLLTLLIAADLAMSAFVSPWFLLVPLPALFFVLPAVRANYEADLKTRARGPSTLGLPGVFEMAVIGAWIMETRGLPYGSWFQLMLLDEDIKHGLSEYALGMEDRFLPRVYNWSRAILVGAYLLKLGVKDFDSWQTRLLGTLDRTTGEEIAPFINNFRQAATELQTDAGEGKGRDRVLRILGNEQTTEGLIGRVVGNYRIIEMIGEGAMGTVFRGSDLMVERDVAIKVLRRELVGRGEVVDRFLSEANVLAKLNHPNIATLHSFFREGNEHFMVMELVPGETLASVVGRLGPLPYQKAVNLFCQILEGIGYAHNRGIVHRDIKPSNVILGDSGSVKVMDFGIARIVGTERKTRFGNIIGTPEYMSPEQIRCLEADSRSDIYSLGVLLFEMLTGRLPFTGNEYELFQCHLGKEPPSPRAFVEDIPAHLEQAVLRALIKNPSFRFQSAVEFGDALFSSSANGLRGTMHGGFVALQRGNWNT